MFGTDAVGRGDLYIETDTDIEICLAQTQWGVVSYIERSIRM